MDMEQNISATELLSGNWFPKKIYELDNKWHIDWKFIGDKRFTEPFYEDTMRSVSSEPNRSKSPIEILSAPQSLQPEPVQPTLFIFHISRCGSTLLTQMLSQVQENIVISEAPVIDQLLKAELPNKQKERYVVNLINQLFKKRFDFAQKAFIKFDAWHLFYLETIRNLFPKIPILIIYRDPVEVLKSHAQKRGEHMVPGFFHEKRVQIEAADYVNPDRYAGKVLQLYFETIMQIRTRPGAILLNYNELFDDVWPLLKRQVQINWSSEKMEKMKSRTRYYSKDKTQVFRGDDRHEKSFQPPKNLDILNSHYKQLQRYRKQQRDQQNEM